MPNFRIHANLLLWQFATLSHQSQHLQVQLVILCVNNFDETALFIQTLLEGGPFSYAGYDSVAFIAEQVSHHPPGKLKGMLRLTIVPVPGSTLLP